MSQHSLKTPTIGTVSGVQLSENVNAIADALATNNSGAAEPATMYAHMWWADTTENILKRRNGGNSAWISVMSLSMKIATFMETLLDDADSMEARTTLGVFTHGQCRLVKTGANLVLTPCNGNQILINGVTRSIPSAGVSLALTALAASTVYYVYAYMNSDTMTLEASITTHATDAATGVEIMSGDATRTLVGMARTTAGITWQDTAAQRFVRSWFNDFGVGTFAALSASRTTGSLTPFELGAEVRNEALLWAGETWSLTAAGSALNSEAAGRNNTSIGVDGIAPEPSGSLTILTSLNDGTSISAMALKTGLAEGYHYATLLGAVNNGMGTWRGDVDGRRCSLMGATKR
jgi:hypothetical protein